MKAYRNWAIGLLCGVGLLLCGKVGAADAGTVMGIEDDLTVLGTGGNSADADLEVKGYAVFGPDGGAAGAVTSGVGNVFVAGSAEVASNLYVTGRVGIGTSTPTNALAVNGTIQAREIIVTTNGWADFVFEDGYALMPLEDVAAFIESEGHLPGIPTAEQAGRDGVKVSRMQGKLLQKVEELTLYMIRLQRENAELRESLVELRRLLEQNAPGPAASDDW